MKSVAVSFVYYGQKPNISRLNYSLNRRTIGILNPDMNPLFVLDHGLSCKVVCNSNDWAVAFRYCLNCVFN